MIYEITVGDRVSSTKTKIFIAALEASNNGRSLCCD